MFSFFIRLEHLFINDVLLFHRKKIPIADCIKQSTLPCSSLQEHMLVRTTMVNTLSEIDRICRIDNSQSLLTTITIQCIYKKIQNMILNITQSLNS